MNSREKAEHLFSGRYGGKEFFEEEMDMLTELLDQHEAEAVEKAESRRMTLLQAAYALLRKCDEGPYIKNALEETVFYDGTDCDGTCLMEDIMYELDLPEPWEVEKEDE